MKNSLKATVGAVIISLSFSALAAGNKDVKDMKNDKTAKDTLAASAALEAAGATKTRADMIIKSGLIEASKLDASILGKASKALETSTTADLVKGLRSGEAKRVDLAKKAIEVAAKVDANDSLGIAVVEALSQGSAKKGQIFEGASEQQLAQALVLADKMLIQGKSTRSAIADYLSTKNGKSIEENSKEVDEFSDALGKCAKRG